MPQHPTLYIILRKHVKSCKNRLQSSVIRFELWLWARDLVFLSLSFLDFKRETVRTPFGHESIRCNDAWALSMLFWFNLKVFLFVCLEWCMYADSKRSRNLRQSERQFLMKTSSVRDLIQNGGRILSWRNPWIFFLLICCQLVSCPCTFSVLISLALNWVCFFIFTTLSWFSVASLDMALLKVPNQRLTPI